MQQTFTKVFGPNTKPGAKWTRWDYKTANDDRFVHFSSSQDIPLDTVVILEVDENKITSWEVADNQQTSNGSPNGSQAVRTAPMAPQGHPDNAKGKTLCVLWANLLPAVYASITPKSDQTVEAAGQLVDFAMGEIFPEDES